VQEVLKQMPKPARIYDVDTDSDSEPTSNVYDEKKVIYGSPLDDDRK
jgi:hypothetical protein